MLQTEYMLALLVVVGLLLLLTISWIANILERKNRQNIRPLLTITKASDGSWWVENLGVGVALHPSVWFKKKRSIWGWASPQALAPMAVAEQQSLDGLIPNDWAVMGIHYEDMNGNCYQTIFYEGGTIIYKKRGISRRRVRSGHLFRKKTQNIPPASSATSTSLPSTNTAN